MLGCRRKIQPSVDVIFQSRSTDPITIGFVKTFGVSASSLLRAGSGGAFNAESRIKHTRIFNNLGSR